MSNHSAHVGNFVDSIVSFITVFGDYNFEPIMELRCFLIDQEPLSSSFILKMHQLQIGNLLFMSPDNPINSLLVSVKILEISFNSLHKDIYNFWERC